jgi:hypothetical protein
MHENIIVNYKKYSSLFWKNGFYIPIVSVLLYQASGDLFLSSIIGLKLFPANFFYWFYEKFTYFPEPYKRLNQFKQFVRLTDSGHIVSFVYYFYPQFFPIAFNLHFIITLGYWYSVIVLKMSDTTEFIDGEYVVWFNNLWAYAVHGIPLVLLIRELMVQDVCYHYFTVNDLYYSYAWVYSWLLFVYLPWRYFTKDPVYSILDTNGPFSIKIKIFTIMNVALFISNIVGYYISQIICKYQ